MRSAFYEIVHSKSSAALQKSRVPRPRDFCDRGEQSFDDGSCPSTTLALELHLCATIKVQSYCRSLGPMFGIWYECGGIEIWCSFHYGLRRRPRQTRWHFQQNFIEHQALVWSQALVLRYGWLISTSFENFTWKRLRIWGKYIEDPVARPTFRNKRATSTCERNLWTWTQKSTTTILAFPVCSTFIKGSPHHSLRVSSVQEVSTRAKSVAEWPFLRQFPGITAHADQSRTNRSSTDFATTPQYTQFHLRHLACLTKRQA